jgi:acyl-CoA synthetase (AMP-forming)/AMP-acid ligase II
LCARKIPDKQLARIDLSRLRLAYVGAEPVDAATLDAFVARFAAHGLSPAAMYPVYGLAEATLAVAFPVPGAPPRFDTVDRGRLAAAGIAVPVSPSEPGALTFVSVGQALPRHRVAIVSADSGERLGERRVGELVVEGDSVTPGYFGEAGSPARRALATGDLAYHADGEIYVVDRIKDLVIVAGQNYAPSDIEGVVAGVDGVRRGRVVAFSAPGGGGTEELHVVAEASPDSWRPPAEVEAAVRRRVRHDVGVSVSTVTIVAPGTLERTSSGKLKRRACAEAHRAGTLRPVRSRADVLAYQWVRRRDRALVRATVAARIVLGWLSAARG